MKKGDVLWILILTILATIIIFHTTSINIFTVCAAKIRLFFYTPKTNNNHNTINHKIPNLKSFIMNQRKRIFKEIRNKELKYLVHWCIIY